MRQGCYKLCPRVTEQLRKAREAEETSDESESGSYERIKGVAGPSGVRRRASEDSSHYSSDEAAKKRERVKKKSPGDNHENSASRNKERKKQNELDQTRRKKEAEKTGEKDKRRKPEVEKKRDREAPGPSRNRRKRKGEDSSKNKADKRPIDRHDNCDSNCRGIGETTTKIKNDKRQETFDEYIINKSLCYFEDLCNCSYACLINQFWKDPFVTSTIASAALFAIGLKLCCEMDGWRIVF